MVTIPLINKRQRGNLFISEQAYNNLTSVMHTQGYQGRMLGKYLTALANVDVQWYDARPEHIREQDSIAARWNLAPIWNDGAPHLAHDSIKAPTSYLESVARSHNIRTFKEQLPMLRGVNLARPRAHSIHTSYALASAVVEAIGLMWLRPVNNRLPRTETLYHPYRVNITVSQNPHIDPH